MIATILSYACVAEAASKQRAEIRGVWVATVNNIDWPSKRGLTTAEQKSELIRILDLAASLGLNAVFLQVRPAADAVYPADAAPWTEYLTGTAGTPPDEAYDPLEYAVTEAHKRRLQLHAWFNPFRARHSTAVSPLPPSHIAMRRPDLVRTYGTQLWLDPGEGEARREVIDAVCDVVKRYRIDGVHMDDYFYPYPELGPDGMEIPFPDDVTWRRYRTAGGRLGRDDWRRDNINRFLRTLYSRVKAIRRDVLVGISPFGIWRPYHPPQVRGFDAYAKLYADSRLWLRRGWVDYLAPQLYWPIDRREQSFSALLGWWLAQDWRRRGIVAGMSVSRVANGRANAMTAEEIKRQIEVTRSEGSRGFILFSARALLDNRGGVADVVACTLHRCRAGAKTGTPHPGGDGTVN